MWKAESSTGPPSCLGFCFLLCVACLLVPFFIFFRILAMNCLGHSHFLLLLVCIWSRFLEARLMGQRVKYIYTCMHTHIGMYCTFALYRKNVLHIHKQCMRVSDSLKTLLSKFWLFASLKDEKFYLSVVLTCISFIINKIGSFLYT